MVNMEEAETIVNSVLSSLTDLSEDLGDTIKAAVGSPIKFIKIKNNLKKWAKFKLDVASVEMDAIRKKEASKEDPKGIDKEKLETAVKAKKDAIHGKMDDINDRLNDLAVNDSLKAVVRLGKHKASLEANTKLLKIAQSEENDALKLKLEDQIESDKEAITNAEDQLKTYAKDADASKSEPAKAETAKSEPAKEKAPAKKKKEEAEETTSDTKANDDNSSLTKTQAAKKEKATEIEKEIPEIEAKLKEKEEAHQITITNNSEAEKNLLAAKDEGDEAKIKDAEEKYTELSSAVQSESSDIAGYKAKIKELNDELAELKKSFESEDIVLANTAEVNETIYTNDISNRFRNLMNKM